ncbi:MAG: hypothetical protein WAV07_14910 [Candidatus Contendobacter sp.]
MKYLTWLDWFVDSMGADYRLLNSHLKPIISATEATYWSARQVTDQAFVRGYTTDDQNEIGRALFCAALVGFCNPEPKTDETRAALRCQGLKLPTKLVHTLSNAYAPQTNDWKALARDRCWYFDLPPRSLVVEGDDVRAIFTWTAGDGKVSAVAIHTPPNSNEIAGYYVWWLLENPSEQPDSSPSLDPVRVAPHANDFIALALLYYQSQQQRNIMESSLTVTQKDSRNYQKKGTSDKPLTFFAIHTLSKPHNNLDRSLALHEGRTWKLDHLVPVRGHFRLQPVGKQRSRHELRWIADHIRGTGLPQKPMLTPLRMPND